MPRVSPGLLAGLLGLTAIRLLLAATLPIGDDEAYYWEWSRHLAAGYVDHPPAVAYLVWTAVRILGQTPFAIHAVAVVLSLAASLALWTLAVEVTGRRDAAAWAVIFYSVIPVFMAGPLLTAPDAPLFLCWTRSARPGGPRKEMAPSSSRRNLCTLARSRLRHALRHWSSPPGAASCGARRGGCSLRRRGILRR